MYPSSNSSSAASVLEPEAASVTATSSSSEPRTTSVARVAGWPVDAVAAVGAPAVATRVAELVDAQQRHAAEGRLIADLLYEPIGREPDRNARRALLDWRRAAFQDRPVRRPLDASTLATLDPSLAERLRSWQENQDRLATALEDLQSYVDGQLREQSRRLVRLAHDDSYRRAVLLASPQVSTALDRADADGCDLDLKAAVSAHAYAIRMATKTSPYSSMTSIVPVRWATGEPWLRWNGAEQLRTRPEIALDVLNDIEEALRSRVAPRLLLVRRNPSCRVVGDVCRYVVRRRWAAESVRQLALTPAIRCVLDLVDEDGTPHDALLSRVSQAFGGRPDQVSKLVQRLVDAGVLGVDFGVPDQSLDPLGELARRVGASSASDTHAVDTLRRLVAEYADAGTHGARTRLLGEARRCTVALLRTPDPADERQVLVEDSYLGGTELLLSPAAWRPVVADLQLCAGLLELQDPALCGRLRAAALFRERYGARQWVPLMELFDDAHRGPADAWRRVLDALRGVPLAAQDSREKDLIRRRDALARWLQARPPTTEAEIAVPQAVLAEAVGKRPPYLPACRSLATFCLPMAVDGQRQVVLSAVQTGHGRHAGRLARFTGSDRRAGAVAEPVPVEVAGAFSSNLNLHGCPTPYEISYPGSVSDRPPAQRLALDDLSVSLDAESGLLALWSHRLGARVLPVHRGSGSVKLLPPLARFIIGLFTDGPVDAVAPWQALWRRQDEDVDHGALSPRLRIGNVVFDRRKMVLAASELPHRGKAEPVGGYLVRVEHWRRERGVPQTCFVRFVDLAGPAAATRRHARWPAKERKPMLINFVDPLSVLELDRLAARANAHAVIEEALPAATHLPADAHGRRRVVEVVLELSRP